MHGFFSPRSSTTSWKSNKFAHDSLASPTFLFFVSISYSVNASRLNYSQNIVDPGQLRLTFQKRWLEITTYLTLLRCVNSSKTSDNTACIVGMEPLMRTLFRFVFAIPYTFSDNSCLMSEQVWHQNQSYVWFWSSFELVCKKLQKLFSVFLQFDCCL